MNDSTKTAIRAICAADPSVGDDVVSAVMAVLSGAPSTMARPAPVPPLVPIVTRADAARLLGLSCNRVDFYARQGALKRAYAPGSKRAIGFTGESVRAILDGTAARAG